MRCQFSEVKTGIFLSGVSYFRAGFTVWNLSGGPGLIDNVGCVVRRRKKEYETHENSQSLGSRNCAGGSIAHVAIPAQNRGPGTAGSGTAPRTAGARARSSRPGGATQLFGGIRVLSARRGRRLGAGSRQSATDYRRQFVG